MVPRPLHDFKRLCLHTVTTKPWPVEKAIERYAEAGIGGITIWRQALAGRKPAAVGTRVREAGLALVSLCRGGFFAHAEPAKRRAALQENLRALEEAAELDAPLLVIVAGADPAQSLAESRKQILTGLETLLPRAESVGMKLALEPLHPMYADDRSAINTLAQANDVCQTLDSPYLGVAVDVYHLWWDPNLESEIARCGRLGKLFAFHICDWKTPTEHVLYDRGLMGEGCIPLRQIRGWVEEAGFDGFHEVEIFSRTWWSEDQDIFLDRIKESYLEFA